jgi:hypothetical protein
MSASLPSPGRPRLRWLGALTALLLLCLTVAPGRCWADAGRWLASPSYAELSQELAALHGPDGGPAPSLSAAQQQRLADLTVLEQAIAASDDRSQIANASSHNLGVLTLSKKALPGTAATFGVLAPGHETDDDFSVVALVVPPEVSLQWGEAGQAKAQASGQLLRLPEGAVLRVSDPAPDAAAASGDPATASAEPSPVAYALNLPPFALERSLPDGNTAPSLSQAELDAQPESAPLD